MGHRMSAATLLVLAGILFAAIPLSRHSIVAPALAAAQTNPADPDPQLDDRIRGWVEGAIDLDSGRGVIRVPAVWMDAAGDLTVVVALREKDDVDAFRAAAEEDVLSILRAVYTAKESPVKTATVVGTYSVTETGPPRELPILRTE